MKEKVEQVIRELERKASESENRFKKTRDAYFMGAYAAIREAEDMLRQVIADE